MATHPFAMKLEDAIEKAKRLRDKIKAAKVAGDDAPDDEKKTRKSKSTGQTINLGAYGIGGGTVVDDGGATHIYKVVPSPALARLLQNLATAIKKCNDSRAKVTSAGRWQTVGDRQVWIAGSTSTVGNTPCPDVSRIQKEIAKLVRRGGAYILSMRR